MVATGPAQLRPEAIGDPEGGADVAEEFGDHVLAAARTDDEATILTVMEGPQPPVPLADPHAGLIRLQHAAGEQTGADQAPLPGEGRPAVGQHGDQGALADRKPKQIGHQPHQPLERDRMDEPQIDDKGPQVRTERRAGRHVGRRFGPERLAAAGAEPAIQRHPRDVRLDRGKLDVVVGVERGLRDARQVGPAMSAMIGQDVALARRIGMQGTVRSGMRCASARAPARRRRVGRRLPALRGRRAGIVRRLRWQLQLLTQRRVLRRNAPLSASRRDSRAVNISTCRFSAAIVSACVKTKRIRASLSSESRAHDSSNP